MPIDPNTIATIALAGVGGAASVAVWALRLEGRLTTHEKTDTIIHTHVHESLAELKKTVDNMDTKIDKLVARR